MKRFFCVLITLCILCALCACQTAPAPTESVTPDTSAREPATETPTTETPTTEAPTTEPPTTEPPEPYEIVDTFARVYRDESGTIWAMAVSRVANTGQDTLLLDFGSICLKDPSGKEVATLQSVSAYPQVIGPGETAVYCDVIALDIAEIQDLHAELTAQILPTKQSVERCSFPQVSLTDSLFGGMVLQGVLTNDLSRTESLFCVVALLYDAEGVFVGFINGYVNHSLDPGQSVEFSFESFMLPTELKTQAVASYEIYGYSLYDMP